MSEAMAGYYAKNLAAERLRRVYDIAPPRVRRYLDAELEHVRSKVRASDVVLELGCGYGRVLEKLSPYAHLVVGIDSAAASLTFAREWLGDRANVHWATMDAITLGFRDGAFDVVTCIQNGISAFGVDRTALMREAVRVTRPGGTVLFSTYAAVFWPDRLDWFRRQAAEGLIGEIDPARTCGGVITCKDGFRATTATPDDFRRLAATLNLTATIQEVDASSLFCEIRAP